MKRCWCSLSAWQEERNTDRLRRLQGTARLCTGCWPSKPEILAQNPVVIQRTHSEVHTRNRFGRQLLCRQRRMLQDQRRQLTYDLAESRAGSLVVSESKESGGYYPLDSIVATFKSSRTSILPACTLDCFQQLSLPISAAQWMRLNRFESILNIFQFFKTISFIWWLADVELLNWTVFSEKF